MSAAVFTETEVEAAAGVTPWKTQRKFSGEIDPDHMAEKAVVYRRAFEEARVAGDVAELASRISGESGQVDDSAMADPFERTAGTDRDLADRGEGMEAAADLLSRSMRVAVQHERQVRSIVEERLDPGLAEVSAAAERAMADAPAPMRLAVRTAHLMELVARAQRADTEIDDEIAAYRSTLTRYGQELYENGYDLAGGPLGLWRSPDMAEYLAAGLKDLLKDGKPDPDDLLRYTSVLNALSRDVRAGGGEPRDLEREEAVFLMTFLGELDSDTLAALGNLGTDHLEPAQADTQREALQGVADGLIMVGYLNDDSLDLFPEVPLGDEFLSPREGPLFDHEPGTDEFKAALEKWNGFGALMKEAGMPPEPAHAIQLAHAAVDVQERSSGQYAPRDYFLFELSPDTWVENTGGSGLLHAAALNEDAAADQLRGTDIAERLLRQQWEDSSGVAAYISQGTGDFSASPESEAAARQARTNVLDAADTYKDELAGKGDQDKYGHTDHAQLQETLDMLREDHATAR
ncbi:hypothetical protein [Streptomyces sp. NPDC049879]|uniref:hypothetical protein n=1 Tax=Streptomyces sp. NPDC049879 TaxID=3365598 RepID=UPI0037B0C44D